MNFHFFMILFFIYFSFNPLKFVKSDGTELTLKLFPYVKKLNNKKYIALDSIGIILIDENFQTMEKRIDTGNYGSFSSARSQCVAQYPSEYDDIIIAINLNILYIISQEGDTLVKKTDANFIKPDHFYSIIPYNKEDNKYNFYIIYFDQTADLLKYTKGTYELSSVTFTDITTLDLENMQSYFLNVECSLMDNNDKKIISCFYGKDDYFIVKSLDPDNNLQLINEKSVETPVESTSQRYVYKLKVLPNNQRAILCSYSKSFSFDCAWYDINTNSFYNYTKTGIPGTGDEFYAYNSYIEYFEETHEVLLGKPKGGREIVVFKCSKELECVQNPVSEVLTALSYMGRTNIILISSENKYYAISNDASSPKATFKFELDLDLGLICQNYYNIDRTSCLSYVPDGYYCNDPNAKTIAECDLACLTCDKTGHDSNKCLSCNNKNKYYGLHNETNEQYKSCFYEDKKFEGLYLNLEKNIFEQCFNLCKSCSDLGDENDNKCEECISGYQFVPEVSETNCYQICDNYYSVDKTSCLTSVPDGYYCNDPDAKTIAGCDNKCLTCNKASHDEGKCLTCKNENDYYGLSNETGQEFINCFDKNDKIDGFYFNSEKNIFEPCFPLCKSCSELGDEKDNKCDECKSGYSFNSLLAGNKNCYEICEFYYNIDKTSCLTSVPDGFYCNDPVAKTISECDNECSTCNKESHDIGKCLSCNNENEFYAIYNETNNKYITCYPKETVFEGLYLNTANKVFEPCFYSCKKCSVLGNEDNHQCEQCISGYDYNQKISINNNCYEICEYYYYIDSSNKYQCTPEDKCPSSYKLISSKKKCVKNCNEDELYTCEYKDECLEECPKREQLQEERLDIFDSYSEPKNDSSNNSTNKVNNFVALLRNGSLNSMIDIILTEEEDLTIKEGDVVIQLTSSSIQNNNVPTKNNSVIKLGACETKLKEHYKINQNDSLLIFKVDIPKEGMLSSTVEYEVYHPITKEILNLSYCQDTPIEIHLSASIDPEEIYKYDSDSDFYHDICFSFSNENGTDITINDRREEFYNNNLSICESTCKLMGYKNETQEAICECNIKKQLSMVSEVLLNNDKFFSDFKNIKDIINFKVMKCYKNIFNETSILQTNFGNYICVPIIFFFLIFCFIFCICGFSKLKLQITDLLNKMESFNKVLPETKINKNKTILNIINRPIKETNNKKILSTRNNNNKTIRKQFNNRNIIQTRGIKKKFIKKNIIQKEKAKKPQKKIKFGKVSKNKKLKFGQLKRNKKTITNKIENKSISNNNTKNKSLKKKEGKNDYTDNEMNSFTYEEALEQDKRSCSQYYISLLRTKHLLLFTFYPIVDYNSVYIKLSLLLFNICLSYTVNALFYNESTIHKIYESQGLFSFAYRLPQIVYSTLISSFINLIIKILSLSEDDVLKIKKKKNIINMKETKEKLFFCLICKFIFFYLLGTLFLCVFWIYLATFCYVYKNTQYYVIKDATISFGLSLIYPVFYNILPGIFRIPSLKNKHRKYFYIVSKVLQLL